MNILHETDRILESCRMGWSKNFRKGIITIYDVPRGFILNLRKIIVFSEATQSNFYT